MHKIGIAACVGSLALIVACSSTGAKARSSIAAPILNDLKVLVTTGGGTAMAPAFSSDIFDYSLSVQSDISSIGIVAATDPAAQYEMQVNQKKMYAGFTTKVDLAIGDNTINVAVTDGHNATSVYVVRVNRENTQPIVDKFLKLSFADPVTGITMGYRLFVPAGYDSTRSYPLVLFLHGAGEMGSNNEIQLVANQGATVWAKPEQQARHPCFVLAPQCPRDPLADLAHAIFGKNGWTSLMPLGPMDPYRPRPELETVFDLLQNVSKEYRIDKNRIYCTGLSIGGFGTWAIAISHPDTFAALVVIAGGGDPARLGIVANIPSLIFHAVKDPFVPIDFAASSLRGLTKAVGRLKYTEYSEDVYFYPTAHRSWVPAYANAELREWLFQQSR